MLLTPALGIAQVVKAPVLKEKPPLTTREEVRSYIIEKAKENNIPVELALYVADKESTFGQNPIGDTDIICPRTGEAVYARGVYQLTRCYYPQVSDQDAFDNRKNIDYVFDNNLLEGKTCKSQFTTCRHYYLK